MLQRRHTRIRVLLCRYIDALYWSLTTMTTIGYGDRSPQTTSEIVFVLFCEVFGLAAFALLITQVNTLSAVMNNISLQKNADKNNVVQFMIASGIRKQLIDRVVRYLNFQSNCMAGADFGDSGGFDKLTDTLRDEIKIALFTPTLSKVPFFGWSEHDAAETRRVRAMFDQIDDDGSGLLDKSEVKLMLKMVGMDGDDEAMDGIFEELDANQTGDVGFETFKAWWYFKTNGRHQIERCPKDFMHALALHLHTSPCAVDEKVVEAGDYGTIFGILLTGQIQITQLSSAALQKKRDPVIRSCDLDTVDHTGDGNLVVSTISHDDPSPIFGMAAVLNRTFAKKVQSAITDTWEVRTTEYSDMAWLHRADMLACFKKTWPQGLQQIRAVALDHYLEDVETRKNAEGLEELRVMARGDDEDPLDIETELEGRSLDQKVEDFHQRTFERLHNVEKKQDEQFETLNRQLQQIMGRLGVEGGAAGAGAGAETGAGSAGGGGTAPAAFPTTGNGADRLLPMPARSKKK